MGRAMKHGAINVEVSMKMKATYAYKKKMLNTMVLLAAGVLLLERSAFRKPKPQNHP
jgi:hypothetical protein